MSLKDSLLAAAKGLPRALNLTDFDLRQDHRFNDKGIVVPAADAQAYQIGSGEQLEVEDNTGRRTAVMFFRLGQGDVA